jgi:hypothetical protein
MPVATGRLPPPMDRLPTTAAIGGKTLVTINFPVPEERP